MKPRLFVAIELSDEVRAFAQGAAAALAAVDIVGKFEPHEKLHVTVAFLGATEETQMAEVRRALREGAGLCRPFVLNFETLGAFPSPRRPRVLWLGPQEPSADFAGCANVIRGAFARLGFTFDHEPQPHITLCRLKVVPASTLPALDGRATLSVQGLTLFQSLPAGRTTRYEALERVEFGA